MTETTTWAPRSVRRDGRGILKTSFIYGVMAGGALAVLRDQWQRRILSVACGEPHSGAGDQS